VTTLATLRRFLPLILLAAAAAAIVLSGAHRYLSFDAVREAGEGLQAQVDRHWLASVLILMIAFALLTASITPGVFFLTILAGYLFGPWVGGVATSAAATAGALIVYWVGSTAARDWLRRKLEARGGLLARICERIDRDTFMYVLAARLVVSVPFHLINVAAGLMRAPLKPYAAATFIGILPAHTIYCWIGANLAEIGDESDLRSVMARFALPLAGVAFLSIVLPLTMRAWKRRRARD
jgi:uncharacterized membrane protein YdjX (TVP38/TMEM64 family)